MTGAATNSSAANRDALYVYCVAGGEGNCILGPIGLGGESVYTVGSGSLRAVVHNCQGKPYQSTDPQIVQAWVVTHQEVVRAVITVPAYFNDSQRRATKDAAAIAGLEVVRLFNEPTAAALAYGLDIEKAHTILVWDLGGGTFDVSVLELGDGVVAVRAVNGNTQLGGDDYDQRLARLLAEEFRNKWRVDLDGNPSTVRLLRQLAEEAKMRLSTDVQTDVVLPYAIGMGKCVVTVTRDAFEQATADITEKMAAPAMCALADAGLDLVDLDRVVLVGGMTRMPAVRRLVKQLTGLDPYGHINPEALAQGNAEQIAAAGAALEECLKKLSKLIKATSAARRCKAA